MSTSMLDVIHSLNDVKINPKTLDQYVNATAEDESLSKVINYYKDGWPIKINSDDHELNHYFSLRNDLYVQDNLVYLNEKLVIPKAMRRHTLHTLHETHLGFNKLKLKAQQLFYWPGYLSDLKNMINKCATCAKFQRAKIKDPLKPHEVSDIPFYKVGIDLADFEGESYLVLMDYYSRWLEVEKIRNKSAFSVIQTLKPIFARFGIPKIIICDNVPFNSYQFVEFAEQWNFEVRFSSPHYPRSNGLAEKAVDVAKNMLRKSKYDKSDLQLYLLNYRSTPVANLQYSPSQLLQSRLLNSKLPLREPWLKPNVVSDPNDVVKSKIWQKVNYDKTARKEESVFTKDQKVLVRNIALKQWEPGQIKEVLGNRSYLVEVGNKIIRRNAWFIRKRACLDIM